MTTVLFVGICGWCSLNALGGIIEYLELEASGWLFFLGQFKLNYLFYVSFNFSANNAQLKIHFCLGIGTILTMSAQSAYLNSGCLGLDESQD